MGKALVNLPVSVDPLGVCAAKPPTGDTGESGHSSRHSRTPSFSSQDLAGARLAFRTGESLQQADSRLILVKEMK